MRVDLDIERVILPLSAAHSEEGRRVVATALERLADRLSTLDDIELAHLEQAAVDHLELTHLSPVALLGPDGAGLLADALFNRLIRGVQP